MFHRLKVWWHMWLKIRFKAYAAILYAMGPLYLHLFVPWQEVVAQDPKLSAVMFWFMCLMMWAMACAVIGIVLAIAYDFELKTEEDLISFRNDQEAQGGELTVHNTKDAS